MNIIGSIIVCMGLSVEIDVPIEIRRTQWITANKIMDDANRRVETGELGHDPRM